MRNFQIATILMGMLIVGGLLADGAWDDDDNDGYGESSIVREILEDLQLKKQFYSLEFPLSEASSTTIHVIRCDLKDATACAFNVESIQLREAGSSVPGLYVDGLFTPLGGGSVIVDGSDSAVSEVEFPTLITTPTNLLLEAGAVQIGASESVRVLFEPGEPYTGAVVFTGQKPQGMELVVVQGAPGDLVVSAIRTDSQVILQVQNLGTANVHGFRVSRAFTRITSVVPPEGWSRVGGRRNTANFVDDFNNDPIAPGDSKFFAITYGRGGPPRTLDWRATNAAGGRIDSGVVEVQE